MDVASLLGLQLLGIHMNQEDIDSMLKEVDNDGSGNNNILRKCSAITYNTIPVISA